MSPFLRQTLLVVLGCATISVPRSATAARYCLVPPPTLNEAFVRSNTAVLARWVSGEEPADGLPGRSVYEVIQVPRAGARALKPHDRITVPHFRNGKKLTFALILGAMSKQASVEWSAPLEVDSALYNYIVRAPARDADAGERALYYLDFLEDANKTLAGDALIELTAIPIHQLIACAHRFPRDLLRSALCNPDIDPARISIYALMLGLCGDNEDAEIMIEKITEPADDFRPGIESVMTAYLLLTGERGLERIEQLKLHDENQPFSETYAAVEAVRFLWTYGECRIPRVRLQAALHPLIDRPEEADLVIAHLSRWKDWSVQPRLMKLFGAGDHDITCIKRAIIRYMIASTRDVPAGEDSALPHAVNGARNLDELRRREPRLVEQCEWQFTVK
jgi:hypothetical protein